ncbi:MAG: F0F1 ATP synthase subunit epsilon [Kiritimatiellia bacterium]
MQVTILSPKRLVFKAEARSVFLPGDMAEFEILDHHAPILSLLRPGVVVVDSKARIPIKRGIVKFDENECTILLDE